MKKILLLGSGELGKEFVISAQRKGQHIIACDSYAGAPAMQVADEFEIFDMLNGEELERVVKKHRPDIIVPEIEAIRQSKWWSEQILAGKPILLNTLEQLPEEAADEYQILAVQGIRSLMVTPLLAGDHIWGYMGIDLVKNYHDWSNEDFQWFSICMAGKAPSYLMKFMSVSNP